MKRAIQIVCVATARLLTGCFKEVGYKTNYVVKPYSEVKQGDRTPLEGVQAFAYEVDTVEWTIASYDDALQGIITRKGNPNEQLTSPVAVATPSTHESAQGWVEMPLKSPSQMVVVVDTEHQLYAYTQQHLEVNVPTLYVSLLFKVWKEGNSYAEGGTNTKWSFYNAFYRPPTTRVLNFALQVEGAAGEEPTPLSSSKGITYAYMADTTQWRLASYDDARLGVITSKSNPTEQRAAPHFKGYYQSEAGLYEMSLKSSEESLQLMLVAVDTEHKLYAYTQQTVAMVGDPITYTLLFQPWQEQWTQRVEEWVFVDESHAPQPQE